MARMSSISIPGSSEPYHVDSDVDSPVADANWLSDVPEHPHNRSGIAPTSPDTPSKPKLGSINHPTITRSRSTPHARTDSDTALDPTHKRRSIGSKLLSKLRTGSTDEKQKSPVASPPNPASGAQAPSDAKKSERAVSSATLERSLRAQQNPQIHKKRASFASVGLDGLRQRATFRANKSKRPPDSSDADEEDGPYDFEETPRYLSQDPTELDRARSDATRHFPGGLYDAGGEIPPSSTNYEQHLLDNEQHEDLFIDDDHHQHEYESDDSDDTIAHLIREAEGYDSLRYTKKGELAAGLDFDTLQAVRDKERTLSGKRAKHDAHSEHSAYSGGASRALSQPLLELEDIELETFLQNFARHTREVTVTRPSEQQKYRMPKWSDFRVSTDMEQERSGKRPSMLTRVDRSLHQLSDNIRSVDTSKVKGTSRDDDQNDPQSMPISKSAEHESAIESSSEAQEKASEAPSPSKKKAKSKASRKQSTAKKDSTIRNAELDEDWDLVVPSSRDRDSYEAVSPHDELRVDAEDEGVDGVAFCIAYILALVERLAPEEIDHHPDRRYREGLIRSHVERLYTIAPFWEQLALRTRRLYRWEDPKTTAAAAMIYFVLWYTNMIPTAFILMIMFYIMRFKYFPPSESYLHDKVKMRMARGQAANTLSERLRRRSRLDILNIYKRWVVTFGAPTQEAMGLVADFHEKVKNLILWRNPAASRRTLILFAILNLFVTFAPSQYVSKAIFFVLGITFFCLLPLQSYFPSHRKALSPLWWATFGAPTDAQFAVQLLRKRHLDIDRFAGQLTSAEDVRRAVRSQGSSKLKPRPDRREEGIAYDQIEDPSRASLDYVEMSNDATLKPRKLGSFFCQYKGLPGRLHVNTKYLYFTPLHSPSHKRGRTPVDAIESIVKTKNIRLWVWNSLGLKMVRNNGKAPLLLANVQHRDEAFNLILAVTTNVGGRAS